MIKKCCYCGKLFPAKISRAMYCSLECRRSSDRDNKRINYIRQSEVCIVCGKQLPKNKTSYCSISCKRNGHPEIKKKCAVCGKEFETGKSRKTTCSETCRKMKKDRRYLKYKDVVVDTDITLKRLAERDNQQCQICGLAVDWNDKTMKNGYCVCGRLYPSIDHIKPLSKGGVHSWDNVQLSHMCCNVWKSNKLAI